MNFVIKIKYLFPNPHPLRNEKLETRNFEKKMKKSQKHPKMFRGVCPMSIHENNGKKG